MSGCPGRCNPRVGGVVLGEPVWCVGCGLVVRSALCGLPEVFDRLGEVSPVRCSPLDVVRVSGSRERVSPSVAVDVRDEIFQSVRCWEDRVRRWLGLGGGCDGGSREETLCVGVEFLSGCFEEVMRWEECAEEFGREMNVLFSSGLRIVKDGPLRSLLLMPCGWCGRRALMQQEGVALVPWFTSCEERLGGCGRLFSEREMVWMAHARIAVER